MLRRCVVLLSVLALAGCSGVGPTANVASSTPSVPTPNPPTTTTPPTTTAPPPTTPAPPATTSQSIVVWGNSQTAGYGLSDPTTQAWPAVMAAAKGWQLSNLAVSATTCYQVTNIWDYVVDANSISAYGHFHNEELQNGQDTKLGIGCIEAQTAWLAIPETNKARGNQCVQSGGWQPGDDSTSVVTTTGGATLTCEVTGNAVAIYLVAARTFGNGIFTVTLDGQPVTDPETNTTTFQEEGSFDYFPRFIRIPTIRQTNGHVLTYTCVNPVQECLVYYVAGVGLSAAPPVYSLSPVPNASWNTGQNFDPTIYAMYVSAWKTMVAELQGDGLNIIPVDVNNTAAYDPNTQSQGDGVHETAAGHASIGAYAATLK